MKQGLRISGIQLKNLEQVTEENRLADADKQYPVVLYIVHTVLHQKVYRTQNIGYNIAFHLS